MHDQAEWERRVNKRKYRLMAAAEDAFAHVQTVQDMQAHKVLSSVEYHTVLPSSHLPSQWDQTRQPKLCSPLWADLLANI